MTITKEGVSILFSVVTIFFLAQMLLGKERYSGKACVLALLSLAVAFAPYFF